MFNVHVRTQLETDPTTPISVVMPDPPTAGSTTGLRLNVTFTQQELLSIVGRAASVAGGECFHLISSFLCRLSALMCEKGSGDSCGELTSERFLRLRKCSVEK